MKRHDGSRRRLVAGAGCVLAGLFAGAASAADLYVSVATHDLTPGAESAPLAVALIPSHQAIKRDAPGGALWHGIFDMDGRLFQQISIAAKPAPGARLFGRVMIFEVPIFHALKARGVRIEFPLVVVKTSHNFITKQFANYGRFGAFDGLDLRTLLLNYQTFRATARTLLDRLKREGTEPDYFDIRAVFLHVYSGGVLISRNYRVQGSGKGASYIARAPTQFLADPDLLDSAEWLGAKMLREGSKVDDALRANAEPGTGRALARRALELLKSANWNSRKGKYTTMWRKIATLSCERRQKLLEQFQDEADRVPDGLIPIHYATIGESIAACARQLAERAARMRGKIDKAEVGRTNRSIDHAIKRLDPSKLRLTPRERHHFSNVQRYLARFKLDHKQR